MMVKVAVPEKFKLRIVPNVRTVLFGGQQEIHYIGGSEVLPPPLENEKEREVVRWLGTDRDEKARKILIEHNLRLVVYIAKKFEYRSRCRRFDFYWYHRPDQSNQYI